MRSPCQSILLERGVELLQTWNGCPELEFRDGRFWCRSWKRFGYEGTGCPDSHPVLRAIDQEKELSALLERIKWVDDV